MTDYQVGLTGMHARNEKTIQATQDWERSRINDVTLKERLDKDCDSLVDLQKEVGAEFVTDGQISLAWQDHFRPISAGFEGLAPGPMVRWFNTNTFFYKPIVKGAISSSGKVLSRAIEKRFVNHGSSLKMIIPDPLTFAELAEDGHYSSKEKLQFAYADALRRELRGLSSLGVRYVQFSAPSLVYNLRKGPLERAALQQLGEALRAALKGVSMRSGFYPYFGDASRYVPDLLDVIPTDDIGFDLTQTDDTVLSGTGKGIIAGLVDSRTTYLEDVSSLASRVQGLADRTGSKTVTLAPSADLRYIPRVSADEKLELLGKLLRRMRKGKSRRRASRRAAS